MLNKTCGIIVYNNTVLKGEMAQVHKFNINVMNAYMEQHKCIPVQQFPSLTYQLSVHSSILPSFHSRVAGLM